MVGAMQVAGPGAPDHLSEDQHEDEEKDADHFQEQDVSHSAEWLEKAPNTASKAAGGTARGAA